MIWTLHIKPPYNSHPPSHLSPTLSPLTRPLTRPLRYYEYFYTQQAVFDEQSILGGLTPVLQVSAFLACCLLGR